MSLHYVNKFMRHVNMDCSAHARYVEDPSGFVADWEHLTTIDGGVDQRPDPPPHPRGGVLTADERLALAERDFGALYELGAHPYLLWSFTEAVWIHERPRDQIDQEFRQRATAVGYPDIRT